MLIQMELRPSSQLSFDEIRDKRAFDIISKIISSIFERISVNTRTAQTHDRAYNILRTCKYHFYSSFVSNLFSLVN